MKLLIIHPGIQHSYRLANALQVSGLYEQIYLYTSLLYKKDEQPILKTFAKRVKPIHEQVIIKNHLIYEIIAKFTRNIYNKLVVNPNKQVHNNPIYFWQFIFGLLCLPAIWWNRKDSMLVTFETAAWPIVWFAKKWNIPVVMDFPSISHEAAKPLGINETNFGIAIKRRERLYIDYALFCSDFCRKSFIGLSSSKKDFVLYLGADPLSDTFTSSLTDKRSLGIDGPESDKTSIGSLKNRIIKISFIANLEYRKGLDILLEALYAYHYPAIIEVHLIGKIRKEWVKEHMPKEVLNHQVKLIYKSAMSQQELFNYLKLEEFDLNIQPSRFDSFAMVVPETMMCGIPNLVSPYVGAGEMITHGKDGFIMQDLSALALNQALLQFINLNADERQQLKDEIKLSTLHMTWEQYNLQVASAFKAILEDHHS